MNQNESTKINHNPNWTYIPDHPHRILIIAGSGLGKTCVIEQNLFIYKRSIWIKVSINY